MIRPETSVVTEAGQLVSTATTKQQAGDLPGALKAFNRAKGLLKTELQRVDIEAHAQSLPVDTAQQQFVTNYVAQLESQCAALQIAVNQQEEEQMKADAKKRREEEHARKKAATAAAAAASTAAMPSVPHHDVQAPPSPTTSSAPPAAAASASSTQPSRSPTTSSSSVPLPPPSKLTANMGDLDRLTRGGGAAAAGGKQPGGALIAGGALRSANYAARASDIVYRAIDHATKLASSAQFKAAADVVQHAYNVGSREDHKPKNLEKLPLLARDLRLKFQGRFPPRPPQDNERTSDEEDVLRASGRTQRLLLFEWDNIDDGYAAENVWMPGRSNAAFEDDSFMPKMAPDQLKEKPRFLRFSVVVECYDRFMGNVAAPAGESQQEQQQQKEADDPVAEADKKAEDDLAAALDLELKQGDGTGADGGDGAEPSKDSTPSREDTAAKSNNNNTNNNNPTSISILAGTPDPMSIRQTVVSDCSLVCSLIVTANFERRFPGSRLIRSAIFPQNDAGEPIVNPKGKYCVKMLLNGTTRVVTIDDHFPATNCFSERELEDMKSKGMRPPGVPMLLCSHTDNAGEMWVPIMEKAFIKVCGGSYDFPGSNSSNDLYRLSGWLPDIVRFPNTGQQYGATGDSLEDRNNQRLTSSFDADLQWRRLSTCHARGAAIMTIATPAELPTVVEEKLKLIPGHAYAVLDFKQTSPQNGNFRLVKVKNPWSSQSWQGLFGIEDTRRCTPEMLQELNWSKDESEQGVFWMMWQDVVKFFAVAHLSWNPFSLYPSSNSKYVRPTRLTRHAHDKSTTSGYCEAHQFQILIPPSQVANSVSQRRMHLVLSRHVLDDSEYEENELEVSTTGATHQQQQNNKAAPPPYIACHVYDTTELPALAAQCREATRNDSHWQARFVAGGGGGRRLKSHAEVQLCKCLHRGIYTNNISSTFSFDCPGGPRELCVIVSRLPSNSNSNKPSRNTSAAAAAASLVHDDCTPFSFSVTLYTNLPYSKSMHDPPALPHVGHSGVHFSAMPPLKAQLAHRSVIPAEWKAGHNCGGPAGGQTFTYNPQFSFSLAQDSHLQAEIISPVDVSVNLYVCRLRDETISNEDPSCPWAVRVDNLSANNHPFVMCAPFSSRYGATVDSSLADCIAIGDKARAPPVMEAPVSRPLNPAPPAAEPKQQPQQQQHQPSIALEIRVATGGQNPPETVFSGSLGGGDDSTAVLHHAVRTAPLSTWLIPFLLTKKHVASDSMSKCVCGGTQLPWANAVPTEQLVQSSQTQPLLLVVILGGTDNLPRTNELSTIERNLPTCATTALTAIEQSLTHSGEEFRHSAALVHDTTERQILALDKCASVTTEDIKKTRSLFVRAFQSLHTLVDFVSKNPPPPPPPKPTAAAAAASSPAAAEEAPAASAANKKNPLRSMLTVPAGRYVVVAAAAEKSVPGPFSVAVECQEEAVALRPVPAEGAGWRPLPNVTAAWVGPSAAGPPAPHGSDNGWAAYSKNPTVKISVPKGTGGSAGAPIIFCRLLSLPPASSAASSGSSGDGPAMQLMLFKGQVSEDTVVASSGRFSSNGVTLKRSLKSMNNSTAAASGSAVVQHGVTLDPGADYFVVMSTFDGQRDSGWRCALKMFVFGDDRGSITASLLN